MERTRDRGKEEVTSTLLGQAEQGKPFLANGLDVANSQRSRFLPDRMTERSRKPRDRIILTFWLNLPTLKKSITLGPETLGGNRGSIRWH